MTARTCSTRKSWKWLELERMSHWNVAQLMEITAIVFADEYQERDSAKWAASVVNGWHGAISQLSLFL